METKIFDIDLQVVSQAFRLFEEYKTVSFKLLDITVLL